jgi:hypothetical protein
MLAAVGFRSARFSASFCVAGSNTGVGIVDSGCVIKNEITSLAVDPHCDLLNVFSQLARLKFRRAPNHHVVFVEALDLAVVALKRGVVKTNETACSFEPHTETEVNFLSGENSRLLFRAALPAEAADEGIKSPILPGSSPLRSLLPGRKSQSFTCESLSIAASSSAAAAIKAWSLSTRPSNPKSPVTTTNL